MDGFGEDPTVTYTRSEFSYDGLGRRIRIVEKKDTRLLSDTSAANWVQVSDRKYIWSGNTIAEERDASTNAVTKRFFNEGEQIGSTNYYFTRDHLGSIKDVINASGTIVNSYDYDPFGDSPGRVQEFGGLPVTGFQADFGFTGHFFHQPTGLSLSLYRAYDPKRGRWLSRDPLNNAETTQGPNLYTYVGNNASNRTDPLGLFTQAEIDDARRISISGLLVRKQQLLALQNGDFQQWIQLDNAAIKVGNASGARFHNAAVDEWEASRQSQLNARENTVELELLTFYRAFGLTDRMDVFLLRTENEMIRQMMLQLWLDQQTPDDENYGCIK